MARRSQSSGPANGKGGKRPPPNSARVNSPSNRRNSTSTEGSAIDQLIHEQVIPRLMMSFSQGDQNRDFFVGRKVASDEIDQFAELPLTCGPELLIAEVDRMRQAGVSTESILVDLLAASARRLGELWEEDECDFVQVTLGLWRLQEVMRDCAIRTSPGSESSCKARTALFTPFPGDQHNFGTLVIEEFFAKAGWATEVLLEPKRHELLHFVAENSLDLVGLTLSCDYHDQDISDLITAIRSVSKNTNVQILVGGRTVNVDPSIAFRTGADGTASDARSALALANRIVNQSEPVGILGS